MISVCFILIIYITLISSFFNAPNMIRYDNIIHLICINENNSIIPTKLKWIINNEKIILYGHENLTNPQKYFSYIIENKYILGINKYNMIDSTFNYTCSSENISNYTYNNLKKIPLIDPISNRNIFIKIYNNLKDFTFINVTFFKIFPKPKCFFENYKGKNFTFKSIKNIQLDKLFYTSELNIKIKKIKCKQLFSIKCKLLDYYILIFRTSDETCIVYTSSYTTKPIIGFCIALFILICITIIKDYFKKRNN